MSVSAMTINHKIQMYRQQERQFIAAAHEAAGAAKACEIMLSELVQAERKAKADDAAAKQASELAPDQSPAGDEKAE